MFDNSHKSNSFFENSFALENQDVLDAMQKAGATLAVMGTNYQDSFALFTGAQEVLQDADKVGNGLKSVAMRIRGYTENAETGAYELDEELSDISGELIDLTKIADDPVLKNGISVYTDDTKDLEESQKVYKSLVDYFRELSQYWDKFSETQQTQLLQKLFGKTQASVGSAIITNFDQVDAALEAMENSAGSADAEMGKVEETITYKINALKETWTGFLQNVVNRDAVKGVIDIATALSEAFTSLGEGGALVGITALVAGIVKLRTVTDATGQSVFSFGNIIRHALGTDVFRAEYLDNYATALNKASGAAAQASLNATNLTKAEKEAVIAKSGLVVATETQMTTQAKQVAETLAHNLIIREQIASEEEITAAKLAELVANKTLTQTEADLIAQRYLSVTATEKEAGVISSVVTAMKGATGISGKLTAGVTTLVSAVGVVPLVLAGVAAAGVGVYALIKKHQKAIEELSESVDSAISTYQNASNTARTTASTISGVQEEYATLSKGVNDLGQNVSLSTEQFERYNEISNQIAELIPELVDHWTDEGNAVLTCKNNVEGLTEAYKSLSVEAANKLINGDEDGGGADDIMKNFHNQMDGLKSQADIIKDAKDAINTLKNTKEGSTTYFSDLEEAFVKLREYGKEFSVDVPAFNIMNDRLTDYADNINALELSIVSSGKEVESQMDSQRDKVQQLAGAYLQVTEGLSSEQKDAVSAYIGSLSDDMIDGLSDKSSVSTLVSNLTDAMKNDPTVSNAIVGLFSLDESGTIEAAKETASIYIDTLKKEVEKEDGAIDQPTYDLITGNLWYNDESSKIEAATKGLFDDSIGGKLQSELSKASAATNNFTDEQRDQWLNWANTCGQTFTSWDEAWKAYQDSLVEAAEETEEFSLTDFSSVTESLGKINTAYQKVAENIAKGKVGKEIASSVSDVEALREEFEGISDFGEFEDFDAIEKILTSGSSTVEQVQSAWNALATAFVNAKMAAGEYDQQSLDVISTQLQAMGVTQASAETYVANMAAMAKAKEWCKQAGIDMTDMTDGEILKMYLEANQADLTKQELLLLELAKYTTNDAEINTVSDIEQLEKLMKQAGATAAELNDLARAKQMMADADFFDAKASEALDMYGVNSIQYTSLKDKAEGLRDQASTQVKSDISEYIEGVASGKSGISLASSPSGNSSSGSGGGSSSDSDSTDKWLEAYEKAYERLGELRDRNKMDEYEYLQYSRALYEKYFDTINSTNEEWNAYVGLKKQYEALVAKQKELQASTQKTGGKIEDAANDTADTVGDAVEGTGESAEDIEKQIEAVQLQLAKAEQNMSDDTREYLEQLEEAEYDYLDGMKSLYESIFSYLTKQLDKQISKWEEAQSAANKSLTEQKEAAVDALNAEKDAAVKAIEDEIQAYEDQQDALEEQIKAYEDQQDLLDDQIEAYEDQQDALDDQIDALNDEVDAINDANEARQREITLQKALYELDNLNTQRSNLVYSESQGMHYESDLSGIRDARDSVQNAKDDIELDNLQKKIDAIEDQKEAIDDLIDSLEDEKDALDDLIEKLEDEKDALDDLIDKLNDQKDEIEDYYDNLISKTEAYWDKLIKDSDAYYDNLIKNLEKTKTAIEDIQDKWEFAEMAASIKDLTGIDISGLWEGLSTGSKEAFDQLNSLIDNLMTDYTSVVATIGEDNTHVLEEFGKLENIDLSKTSNYLDETSSAFDKLAACDFDVVKDGVEGIRKAFDNIGTDAEVFATVGQHLSENIQKGFKDAVSEDSMNSVVNTYGNALTDGFSAFFNNDTKLATNGDAIVKSIADGIATATTNNQAVIEETGQYVTEGVGAGMTGEVATAQIQTDSDTVATNTKDALRKSFIIGSPSDYIADEVGIYVGEGVGYGMVKSLESEKVQEFISSFVTQFATKLKEAFDANESNIQIDLTSLFKGLEDEDGNSALTTFFTELTTQIEEINLKLNEIDLQPLIDKFTALKTAIQDVSSALGGGGSENEEGEKGGIGGSLTSAMQTFGSTSNEVLGGDGKDDDEGSGLIGKFGTLKTKVEDVTSAIGGGESKGSGKGKGGSSESSGTLTTAIEDLGTTTDDVLGESAEGEDEGGEGVIGKFVTLKSKVEDVTEAIGESGGEGGTGDSATLISAMETEEKVALDESKGLPKQISLWDELEQGIQKCISAIDEVSRALSELEDFSLSVSFSSHAASKANGTFTGGKGYADGTFTIGGAAYASGKIGLEKDQQAYVGEVGEELLIRGQQAKLIGKNGAEMMSLKKGDIIFSHSQTKELLKNGKIHSRGKAIGTNAYADGTPLNKMFKFAGNELSASSLTAISSKLTGVFTPISTSIDAINRNVADMAASISNVSSVNNTSNVTIGDIHVSGVQDVDGFAKAIKSYLPGKMMQSLYK